MGPDALALMRGRQRLEVHREALERDPDSPAIGPPGASVTLVEFFDYRCPSCRELAPVLGAMVADDPDLRVVFKEWPVFKGVSITAARTALAAGLQGRYWPLHERLMAMRGITAARAREAAGELGCDLDRLDADLSAPPVERHLALTARLAGELGFRGTPTLVLGRRVIPGALDRRRLAALVELARKDA